MTEPDLPEDNAPISHVWRWFMVDLHKTGMLIGAYGQRWPSTEFHAGCSWQETSPLHEEPPDLACSCGIWGYYQPYAIRDVFEHCVGAEITIVLARCSYWGKTIVGDVGVRAEFAKIIKMWVVLPTELSRQVEAIHKTLKRRYGDAEIIMASREEVLTIMQG